MLRAFFILIALFCFQQSASAVFKPKVPVKSLRAPASTPSEQVTIEERLGLGAYAIIQNSSREWNDEVVKVVEIYGDGSRRLERQNGERVLVRKKNLVATLSPRVTNGCADSHGVNVCEGQRVFYPALGTTLGIPEGDLKYIFENRKAVVKDGVEQAFNIDQVGIEMECSPQKPSVCRSSYVLGDGYRDGKAFPFEGKVEKVYSNGIVVVAASTFWKYPIDVKSVTERVATTEKEIQNDEQYSNGAVITNHGGGYELKKAFPVQTNVTREIEPGEVPIADEAEQAR